MKNDGGPSATYRKVVNKISEKLNKDPEHSKYPSKDFELALDKMSEEMKRKALDWYEKGIKRGMAVATDMVADGIFYFKEDMLYSPKEIKVNVRIKFKGEERESKEFIIDPEEIGFK